MTTEQQYKTYYYSHVKHDPTTGCDLWTASKNNIGYGFFRYDGKMRTVHRLRMEWEGYNIEGKVVYHDCDNYHCVNPNHLNVGTNQQKTDVMTSKGRIGTNWRDKNKYQTCIHCGYHGSPAVVGRRHNDKCKHKP
jgi:hypothetical protein